MNRWTDSIDDLRVSEMNDGGMGSLLLIPKDAQNCMCLFGKQIISVEFTDSDGTPVSIALNVDKEGRLYELDMWKVDFSPLLHWPNQSELRFAHANGPLGKKRCEPKVDGGNKQNERAEPVGLPVERAIQWLRSNRKLRNWPRKAATARTILAASSLTSGRN